MRRAFASLLVVWIIGIIAASAPPHATEALAAGSASSSSSIVLSPDGTRLYAVNPDSGSVSVVDARTDQFLREVSVGNDPRSLAISPDGLRLFVSNQGSATVTVLDAIDLTFVQSVPVGAEPYGVVADPAGRFVYVASTALADIDRIDLKPAGRCVLPPGVLRFPDPDACRVAAAFSLGVSARIPVGPKPKGLAISADGSRLYVTHFLTGEVSVVNTASLQVMQVISTGADSNMAQKIALHPTNGRAYLPHIRSNVANRNLLFDNTVFPVVSMLDVAKGEALPAARVDLSVGIHSVNLPVDMAFAPNGKLLYTVNLGSGDLTIVDLESGRKIGDLDVGEGPSGIVLTADGRKAYVNNSLSSDLSVMDMLTLDETKRIPLTTSPLPATVKRGKLLFFSSRSTQVSRARWMSCASCHFDGESDGRTWFFPDRGPRNTTSLRGAAETRPLHWSADRDEFQDFEDTVRHLQSGTGLLVGRAPNPMLGSPNAGLSADLDALAAYVDTLKPKDSPFKSDTASGRAIFERADVGCASCHRPPHYTDSARHDVGTGNGPDERMGPAFDTPSLRMLWESAPYLHDGSAATLRDVLVTRNPQDRHGRTSQLSAAEIRDLVAFLLSR